MLAFALFAALVTITPGLDTMLVVRTAAVSGQAPAMAAALGIGLGCLCWAVASALGITALLTASELAYQLLRWTGAGYLLFLGVRLLWRTRRPTPPAQTPPAATPTAAGSAVVESSVGQSSVGQSSVGQSSVGQPAIGMPAGSMAVGRKRGALGAFRVGLTTNLLNPKIGVFYLSVLPQFLPAGAAPLPYSMMLALIHDLEGLAWFALLVFVVGRAAGWLSRPTVQRRLEQLTALVFVGFGIRLAAERTPG